MINYTYINNNFKKTILLLQGWGVDSSYMESLKDFLVDDFNVLLMDLKGFGKSKLEKVYSVSDYVEDIHEIVKKEKIEKLYIIGHSFGGKIGAFYSMKYKVEGELLISPSLVKPRFSFIKYIKVLLYKFCKKLKIKIPKFLKGSNDYLLTSGLLRLTFLNVVHTYLNKEDSNKIKIPIIIIGFKNDNEVKLYQLKKLNRWLSNSKLFIYPGNHFSYFQYFKEIRVLLNLLRDDLCTI